MTEIRIETDANKPMLSDKEIIKLLRGLLAKVSLVESFAILIVAEKANINVWKKNGD